MSADFETVENIDDDIAIQVVVRAEYLDGQSEALEVAVDIHEAVDTVWAVNMLRTIADDLEQQHG